jgi:hypothetical protein
MAVLLPQMNALFQAAPSAVSPAEGAEASGPYGSSGGVVKRQPGTAGVPELLHLRELDLSGSGLTAMPLNVELLQVRKGSV